MLPSSEPAKGCGRVALEDLRRVLLRLGGRRRLTHGSQALCALCRNLVHAEFFTRDERKRDARALWRRTIPFESWLAPCPPPTKAEPAPEIGERKMESVE